MTDYSPKRLNDARLPILDPLSGARFINAHPEFERRRLAIAFAARNPIATQLHWPRGAVRWNEHNGFEEPRRGS